MKVFNGKAGKNWILYCGDNREVIREFADASVDHVITDPPYADETHNGARTSINEPLIDFASISIEDLRNTLGECGRLTKRWVVGTMDWHHVAKLEDDPPSGLRFVRFGIWVKPNGAPQFTGDRPAHGWEAVGILHREGGKMRWNHGGHSAVWTVNKVNSDHPTGKPVDLMRMFVQQFTDPGDTILDPFSGSGTTGVAALRMGRKFVGVELNPDYCEIAARRLEAAENEFPLLAAATPPVKPTRRDEPSLFDTK